ncbi:MAG: hypothetical protein JNM17_39660 [Archangium sp.]|nr:hypothetical protein [Archangium sp.]
MEPEVVELHLQAGRNAGVERTCGKKIAYPAEDSAQRMNAEPETRKTLEAYPCASCEKWHARCRSRNSARMRSDGRR